MAKKKQQLGKSSYKIKSKRSVLLPIFIAVFVAFGSFFLYRSFALNAGGSPNIVSTPSTLNPGVTSNTVLTLRAYLKETTGYSDITATDLYKYDPNLVQAVKNFQNWFKLSVDGIVGPKTWAALFKVYDAKLAQSSEKTLSGNGPKVISAEPFYGYARVHIYCPTDAKGNKYKYLHIDERGFGFKGGYDPGYPTTCGSDGTAWVVINYTNNLDKYKGEHLYEIIGGPDGVNNSGPQTHLTFIKVTI